jgi:Ca-activated chloride channel homolog
MSFGSPLALLGLIVVPLAAAAYVLAQRHRLRVAQRFASPALLPTVIDRAPGWRRHLPFAILLLGLATLLAGFARPQAMLSTKRENATVMLAVDSSLSMSAQDIRPSRLAAARTAALRLVAKLPAKYRVGVVTFSTRAEIVAPATRDRRLVQDALAELGPGGATALGDGISLALTAGRAVPRDAGSGGTPSVVPPVSVVLFTDGLQEGGTVSAGTAVARALKLGIPVSTVVVGTPYGIVRVPRVGGFVQLIRVPADPTEAKTIAKVTHGHFYVGPRTADLSPVYRDLGSRLGNTTKRGEVSVAFGIGAIGLLLLGGSLSAVWLRRVP